MQQLGAPITPKSRPVRGHRFIYWHVGHAKWMVQKGKQYVGSTGDYEEAVAMASKACQLDPNAFEVEPKVAKATMQGQRGAVQVAAEWFQLLWMGYQHGPKGFPCLPSDVTDLHQRTHGPKADILKDAGMILPMLVAKYGPHRDALNKAFQKQQQSKFKSDLELADYTVLCQAVQEISKVCDSKMKPWFQGPGFQTSHHSGLGAFMHTSLKIISPKRPRAKSDRPTVRLGRKRRCYVIRALDDKIRASLQQAPPDTLLDTHM